MILLPLMTAWMWLQILTAPPLPAMRRPIEDILGAELSSLPLPFDGD